MRYLLILSVLMLLPFYTTHAQVKAKAAINVDIDIIADDDFGDTIYSLLSRELRTIKVVIVSRLSTDVPPKVGHISVSLILVPVRRSGDSTPGAYGISLTVSDGFQCPKDKGTIAQLLMTNAYVVNNKTDNLKDLITGIVARIDTKVLDQYR